MFLVSSFRCLCPIHWSKALSREWRCSCSSADKRCSNYIWVIDNYIACLYQKFGGIWFICSYFSELFHWQQGDITIAPRSDPKSKGVLRKPRVIIMPTLSSPVRTKCHYGNSRYSRFAVVKLIGNNCIVTQQSTNCAYHYCDIPYKYFHVSVENSGSLIMRKWYCIKSYWTVDAIMIWLVAWQSDMLLVCR